MHMHTFAVGAFQDGESGPFIRGISLGKELGFPSLSINGVDHEPYIAALSSEKTRVMFVPEGQLVGGMREPAALARRALAKVDPRLSFKDCGDHLAFHGFLTPAAYQGKVFSQPAFDWLVRYGAETGKPLTTTTASINKPIVSLFMQRQEARYGFTPDSSEAIAEIFPAAVPTETAVIRWLYNTLPAERRKRVARRFTFYEVVDGDEMVTMQREPLDPSHHAVAMHTSYSRAI